MVALRTEVVEDPLLELRQALALLRLGEFCRRPRRSHHPVLPEEDSEALVHGLDHREPGLSGLMLGRGEAMAI